MLTVCTWLWGSKFSVDDVNKLAAGVRRHLSQAHRFVVVTDVPGEFEDETKFDRIGIVDESFTKVKGCYARLRMFDPQWQREHKITDRLACIDLDTVITGPLDPLFDRSEPFVIMQKGNASNPCPFNGALMMLRAGAHPEVWEDFSIEAASKVAFYEFPDDQGWIWAKVPDAAGWTCGRESGVYVFRKPGWPGFARRADSLPDDKLPKGARLVTFSGGRSPQKFKQLKWVKENWRL